MSELKALFPEYRSVTVGRTTAKIYPVRLRDLEAYSHSAGSLIALLADATAIKITAYGAKNSESLQRLLRTCTNLSRWRISRLSANDAILFGYQVVRVNYDFFAQALPEVVESLQGGVGLSSGS